MHRLDRVRSRIDAGAESAAMLQVARAARNSVDQGGLTSGQPTLSGVLENGVQWGSSLVIRGRATHAHARLQGCPFDGPSGPEGWALGP